MVEVNLIAICPNCGTEIKDNIVFGPGTKNNTVKGNVTYCPNCGQKVPIDDRKILKT